MPPKAGRKKGVKKSPVAPVRRPSTRRSIAAAAAASAVEIGIVEKETDIVVETIADEAEVVEKETDTVVDTVADETEVVEKNTDTVVDTIVDQTEIVEKEIDTVVETIVDETEVVEKETDTVVETITVDETEVVKKETNTADVEKDTDSTIQEAAINADEVNKENGDEGKEKEAGFIDVQGVCIEEKEKNRENFDQTLLATGGETQVETPRIVDEVHEEDRKFLFDDSKVDQNVKEECANSVGTQVVEKEKDVMFVETPVVACEDKVIQTPLLETPVLFDQKTEGNVSESSADVMLDEASGPSYANTEGSVKKKNVRIVKKVTRRVVVKKKPKVVTKENEEKTVENASKAIAMDSDCDSAGAKHSEMVCNSDENDRDAGYDKSNPNAEKVNSDLKNIVSLELGSSTGEITLEPQMTMEVDELPKPEDGDIVLKVCKEDKTLEEAPTMDDTVAVNEKEGTSERTREADKGEETLHFDDGHEEPTISKEIEESGKISVSLSLHTDFQDEEAAILERRKRRKTEIFIGGLDRNAKEEDIRNVFGSIGEVVDVRLMMDAMSGKNKGYAFLRYATADLAKQAVTDFAKVEVCGKLCGAAALEGNDTIVLQNIDKNWKKEDIIKKLQEIGIEKIDTVTVAPDSNNADINSGFAYLELETNRDAEIAYKKLKSKYAFGKEQDVNVAWAKPLNVPEEEDKKQVKSVFAESVPSSWDEEKLKECFKKFGDIERVVLSCNIPSSKRKDFAFINYKTQGAALSCVESFGKEELFENGSKVNIRVSISKTLQKSKQNKVFQLSGYKDVVSKDRMKSNHRDTKFTHSSSRGGYGSTSGGRMQGYPQHEQTVWRHGPTSYSTGPAFQNYPFGLHGEKRPYYSMGDPALPSDPRHYPRARVDGFYPSPYPRLPSDYPRAPHSYYQQPNVGNGTGPIYPPGNHPNANQGRYSRAPHGGNQYPRY